MVVTVAADYFSTGVWAATGPLRLRSTTCTQCGHRSASWVTFRDHRAHCTAPPEDGGTPLLDLLALSDADTAALAALHAQLPEGA